jgi:hypothetical protein
MAKRNRLTNNTDETDIGSLISGDNVFSIPYFQRPYKWKPGRLEELEKDLLSLVEGASDFHFLGAVIVHGRPSNPSDPDVYEVIDGQQRITTLFLYLAAAVKTLCAVGESGEAAGLFQKYLVINRDTGALSNFKLQSCKEDRAQLRHVYDDMASDAALKEKLGQFRLKPPPKTGPDVGRLRKNYNHAVSFLRREYQQGGVARLQSIYECLLKKMSVVQIDVWDPTNGPKIFDALNSRQEPMTVGDLVRNEIFRKVSDRSASEIERVDSENWQPFYEKFNQNGKNLFDGYFFPFGLIKDPNLTKSGVFSRLRESWSSKSDPVEVIADLAEYQDVFLDIECGTNLAGADKVYASALRRIYETGLPAAVYPFLMRLSREVTRGVVPSKDGADIVAAVEAFLVRRAICGIEPTGLHAVFKKLWADCDSEYTVARVAKEIRKHATVTWPSDSDLVSAIKSRSLYRSSITRFFLVEHDRSLGGDTPLQSPWIEHVAPQHLGPDWRDAFSEKEHERTKDLIANLIPLSEQMNRELSNSGYEKKRPKFKADSMFKSAREFAAMYSVWTPAEIDSRSIELAQWALERWPSGASISGAN